MEMKKVSVRLPADEHRALEAFRAAKGLRSLDAAVRRLIEDGLPKNGKLS